MKYLRSRAIWLIVSILAIFSLTAILSSHAVFAEESSETIVETTFFGNLKDDGQGCGVYTILNLVVDILSMGVGILGVIGIMIAGIQYLTAKGNEEQVKKAKRRIGEIVLGLAAFVTLYVVISWLLPGGSLNTSQTCATVSDEELAAIKAKEDSASESNQTPNNNSNNNNNNNKETKVSWSEKIAQTAEQVSWPKGTSPSKYHHNYSLPTGFTKWSDLYSGKPTKAFMNVYDKVRKKHNYSTYSQLGADCGVFVTTVLKASGHDKKMKYGQADGYYKSSGKWKQVTKAKRGDVCVWHGSGFHTKIYLGKSYVAEANYTGQNFGHIVKGGCSNGNGWTIWRPI